MSHELRAMSEGKFSCSQLIAQGSKLSFCGILNESEPQTRIRVYKLPANN